MIDNNSSIRVIGVIPARYKSSRFEGKPLAMINGVPMIKRTYNQAKKAQELNAIVVATEDHRIADYCYSEDIPVRMTSEECLTGTDRLVEISKTDDFDFYINIQGDEPVIDPINISLLVREFKKYGETYEVYNLYKDIKDINDIDSTNIIKVVVNEKDELIYLSRLPVPYNHSNAEYNYIHQVPAYGFTKKSLQIFDRKLKTLNEQCEDIELLRFIDLGYKIKMIRTHASSMAVDVPSDIIKVEKFLENHQ